MRQPVDAAYGLGPVWNARAVRLYTLF